MRSKVKSFHFCDYNINKTKISFNYKVEFSKSAPLLFSETIILPKKLKKFSQEKFKTLLESLHIILGISYYKLYLPQKIIIPYKLSKEQADFWNKVYKKGLGEFLYQNKLHPKSIAKFPYSKGQKRTLVSFDVKNKVLLGIGGGKDSIVAAELLKDFNTTSFLIETHKKNIISEKIIKRIGNPSLKIKRVLDPKLFEHNKDIYYGHIPISAIYAFLGLFSAALYGYKYITVGNEQSSNFGNLKYHGEVINHQWSKSSEFEKSLQDYTRTFISQDIVYFSLLRQFYEIRIAKIFAKYKKYHAHFTSCNKSFKIFKDKNKNLWCGECPKCAFVFLILSPFLNKKDLLRIFKKNLFSDEKLIPLYNDILGFGKLKPFDCVGTFEEAQAALYLASKKYKNDIVIKTFTKKLKNTKKTAEYVFKTNHTPTIPSQFRFLGINSVCILGYGKEGKISKKYIKKRYPHLKVGVLDQSEDNHYLKKQEEYDLAIKTPGIHPDKVIISYTTATNIFFSEIENFTIGVTGTKGKSTTASLIYEIIKSDGRNVRLLGNIGNPMLEVLFSKTNSDEIFVIELSSYMLLDIEYSPNIAVLLNLFPEHIDYHGSVTDYYNAKKNIFKYQGPNDIAIKPPFIETIPVNKKELSLIGKHNIKNIKAAIKVARTLKVKDETIDKILKEFKPLSHRMEFVGEFQGIKFYDDAISTTPESTIMAIKTLKNIDTIFLGGKDRGYDFNNLEKILKKYKIRNIVLFPDSGKRILKSKRGFNILETKSMEKAVAFAFEYTKKGKICLLSCASPSYSVWKDFEEKGEKFQYFIKKYD